MARIKNVSGDTLTLFTPYAPPVFPGDTITVADDLFVGRAWPSDTWEVVEGPETSGVVEVEVPSADASLWLHSDEVPDPVRVLLTEEELNAMTIAELTEYANTWEIDLSGATLKAEIVAAILNAEV